MEELISFWAKPLSSMIFEYFGCQAGACASTAAALPETK